MKPTLPAGKCSECWFCVWPKNRQGLLGCWHPDAKQLHADTERALHCLGRNYFSRYRAIEEFGGKTVDILTAMRQ